MKALFCAACGDIRGLRYSPVSCECGRVAAVWVDAERGTAIFTEASCYEAQPVTAWLLGIHNALLRGAMDRDAREPSPLEYRAWQQSEGYIFKNVESLIARVRPGRTSDVEFLTPAGFYVRTGHKVAGWDVPT
jgi:hypothetical protein